MINTLEYLRETQGIVVEYCSVDRQGRVLLAELEKQMDEQTFLVCCMVANNETGVIQDIAEITRIAKQHDVLVLTDCVQALGKILVDVHGWGIDYASFSAHKLYGPKGIGVLYVKQGSPFTPFLHGGHQEMACGLARKPPQYCRVWRGLSGGGSTSGRCRSHPRLEEPADPAAQGNQTGLCD